MFIEGAPTPVTAFMAATVKAAALASLIRVFLVSFSAEAVSQFWTPLIWILAVVTMSVGNLTAIWQNNLKRLLAYSSIAHAGYMLLGLLASPNQAQQSIVYYFAAYIFMNLGAFAVVSYLERSERNIEYRSISKPCLRSTGSGNMHDAVSCVTGRIAADSRIFWKILSFQSRIAGRLCLGSYYCCAE